MKRRKYRRGKVRNKKKKKVGKKETIIVKECHQEWKDCIRGILRVQFVQNRKKPVNRIAKNKMEGQKMVILAGKEV